MSHAPLLREANKRRLAVRLDRIGKVKENDRSTRCGRFRLRPVRTTSCRPCPQTLCQGFCGSALAGAAQRDGGFMHAAALDADDDDFAAPLEPPFEAPPLLPAPLPAPALLPLTASLKALPAEKRTFLLAPIFSASPVLGLRPMRAARVLTLNVPSPTMRISPPLDSARLSDDSNALMTSSTWPCDICVAAATSFTTSARLNGALLAAAMTNTS